MLWPVEGRVGCRGGGGDWQEVKDKLNCCRFKVRSGWIGSQTEINVTGEDISTGRALWADSLVNGETIFFGFRFCFGLKIWRGITEGKNRTNKMCRLQRSGISFMRKTLLSLYFHLSCQTWRVGVARTLQVPFQGHNLNRDFCKLWINKSDFV